MKHHRNFTIAIDFDDTIIEGAFPGIGKLKKDADKYINLLYEKGCNIIINTCRSGSFEGDVENFLRRKGINYHYINSNLPESIVYFKQDCRKISADIYIDDKCLMGIPDTSAGGYIWKYYKQEKIEIMNNVKLKIKKIC